MDNDFRERIYEKLSDLSYEDIRLFAWICAVRALPFLGAKGNLKYWKNTKSGDKRQKHLLSVFRALDCVYAANTAASVYAAAAAAYDAVSFADAGYVATAYIAAADAVFAAVYTAYAAVSADPVADAANGAEAAAAAAAKYKIDLRPILLRDMATMQAGKRSFNQDTDIYGIKWDNFQSALYDLDCSYWGDWYAKVFSKGFILDNDDYSEIEMRLNVPGEILELGASAVASYVMDLKESGAEWFNESRVLILGEKGSGKTSLALRLKDPTHVMPDDDASTEGVDIIEWQVPGAPEQPDSDVNVHIWDFAGHVITHAAHRCFMSERCLYILLINGRTEGDHRADYWLEQIYNYGGNSQVLVLVNTWDEHNVDLQENTLRNDYPSILGFFHVNIKSGGEPLEAFRQVVMNLLRDNPLWKNQIISKPAYEVKEALRQRFAQGHEFIERREFEQIAEESGINTKEHRRLLEDLRALGVCLWYDDDDMCEFSTMVLNPGWISYGIYRLINWGLKNNKHILSGSDFKCTFTDEDASRYPREKADFLFRLMKTYQLAFFINTEKIFVPLLLPADRTVSEELPDFPFGGRLRMEYRTNQALPPYTVARLAVLHSTELDEDKSWRFGALLQWEDTTALVEESERARSVTVHMKGPNQTEYISKLRDTLNIIFDDYKSHRPELKYEVLLPDDLEDNIARLSYTSDDIIKLMQPEEQIIGNSIAGQKLVIGSPRLPLIDPAETMLAYNMYYDNRTINILNTKNIHGDFVQGNKTDDQSTHITQYQTINVQFQNCSINFQEGLNFLARSFRKLGTSEDIELAEELEETASDLEEALGMIPAGTTPDSEEMEKVKVSLRKKGLLYRLESLNDELCDENSELHKKAVKIRKGVETLQKLGARYNDVVQWFGIPQIPTSLLGNFGKKG